ncbi:hypothetical protein INT45_001402 [Circinella minor]|uniref:Uncharacterized protein n=1 Tax=Circinella minor TaxID=1195481 RepID=A0A8H7RWM5_9FUNG|nr:hypothetical protein INT45_001402 [Circinella minor]
MNIVRKFASFGAGPKLTDCILADYRLQHSIHASMKNRYKTSHQGYYDPWQFLDRSYEVFSVQYPTSLHINASINSQNEIPVLPAAISSPLQSSSSSSSLKPAAENTSMLSQTIVPQSLYTNNSRRSGRIIKTSTILPRKRTRRSKKKTSNTTNTQPSSPTPYRKLHNFYHPNIYILFSS